MKLAQFVPTCGMPEVALYVTRSFHPGNHSLRSALPLAGIRPSIQQGPAFSAVLEEVEEVEEEEEEEEEDGESAV